MEPAVRGTMQRLAVDELHPDWDNPRFLPGTAETFETDDDVYLYLDKMYNVFPVADSIARHGFFESEPLIAIESLTGYTVLEGNRRLAALHALANPALRKRMQPRRWAKLPAPAQVPADVPVLVVSDRHSVAPILGFRHVTGNRAWDPYPQARYVAEMIDGEQPLLASAVADLIGRPIGEVRSFYRNFSILEQAEEQFQIDDLDRIVDEFGVWTRAMSSVGIRSYIGAPAPREVVEGEYPLAQGAGSHLATLITWLFGEPRRGSAASKDRPGRVISESRNLTDLGAVLQHPAATAELESGAPLEAAHRLTLDPIQAFAVAMAEAQDALERAVTNRPAVLDPKAEAAVASLARAVKKLQ